MRFRIKDYKLTSVKGELYLIVPNKSFSVTLKNNKIRVSLKGKGGRPTWKKKKE